ncbi:MAG: aldehyde ferredoxin oxidoreductase, partial [Desulfamplus sp.]|nr:aldehyde ferredoxin oxidoreductase [Desulfamplus sp.]
AVLDNADGVQTIVDLLNGQYGLKLTPDDVVALGKSILNDEKEFNRRAGFTKLDDQLPEMFNSKFPPHNSDWDFSIDELQETLKF